jgi:hypothetical protein
LISFGRLCPSDCADPRSVSFVLPAESAEWIDLHDTPIVLP